MGERHARPVYLVVNRNEIRGDTTRKVTDAEKAGGFRFSEMVTRGAPPEKDALLRLIAPRMTTRQTQPDGAIPAGFTYLGQFIDHDLTRDPSKLTGGTPTGLPTLSERSPALDLDSVYGRGPDDPDSAHFYEADRVRLKLGTTKASGPPPVADKDMPGFDLPRLGARAPDALSTRQADVPDRRNDENLAVAQVHLAFMRFHNAMADAMPGAGFEDVRKATVLHYQWMVVHDFLPRIVEQSVLDDVFTNGRKVFEVGADPSDPPTMPIEFSVAAYRLGHSMIRAFYDWNAVFNLQAAQAAPAPLRPLLTGSLENLFRFSGTSGNLSPFASGSPPPPDPNARPSDINNPIDGDFDRLPSNWVADFTRLFDFAKDTGDASLAPPPGGLLNMAHRIDTLMTDPLADLPHGSFGARGDLPDDPLFFNLAFRNLLRGRQVRLATAQEVANHFLNLGAATPMLTSNQILGQGTGGVDLTDLSGDLLREATTETPLWFYILREAEVRNGKLGPIGGRIVAETFHRVIEGSNHSILREKEWKPKGGKHKGGFGMVDILLAAYGRDGLRPVAVPAGAPVPA
ncbi:peroxidase family protein [Elioraea rosea]|uniref:peroxidase family protein n=1 Tax=Elioraea rosea TaxID=2492390 RepID=UPI00118303E0|nr:peroxidase family protein [Elioraea rosea]